MLVPVGCRGSEHLCPMPRWGGELGHATGGSLLPKGPSTILRHRGQGESDGSPGGRGAALLTPLPSPREEPVEPKAEAKFRLDFVPHQAGLRKLMVDFESDKLTGVKGYRNVIIAPQPK